MHYVDAYTTHAPWARGPVAATRTARREQQEVHQGRADRGLGRGRGRGGSRDMRVKKTTDREWETSRARQLSRRMRTKARNFS